MDFFQSLWNDPGQYQVPDGENFQLVNVSDWVKHSATYKLISGSFQDPQEGLGLNTSQNKHTGQQSNFHFESQPVQQRQQAKIVKQNKADVCSTNIKSEREENVSEKDVEMDVNKTDNVDDQVESRIDTKRYPYVAGARKHPISDKLSCLDFAEHAQCLRLFLKFRTGKITAADRPEYILYEMLNKKVQEEQQLFLQDARKQWDEVARDVTETPLARKLPVQLIWTGKIPTCLVPTLKTRCRAQIQTTKVLSAARYDLRADQVLGSLHKLPVSLDPNAESLARLKKVQIVISSGALKALVSTHFDHSKYWALPITVKEYRTIDKGKTTTKTIVFIDKPLPKSTMTVDECNQVLFKYGVQARLLHSRHINGFRFPIAGVEPLEKECLTILSDSCTNETIYDDLPEGPNESSSEKNESFKEEMNEVTSPDPAQTNKACMEIKEIASPSPAKGIASDDTSNEDSDEERLVIEDSICPDSVKPSDKQEDENQVAASKDEPSSCALTSNRTVCPPAENSAPVNHPDEADQSGDQKLVEPRKDVKRLPKTDDGHICPLSSTNVTYSSWVIRPDSDKLNVPNRRVPDVAVIVRCRVDGYQVNNKNKKDSQAVSISAKVEHQLEFAAEEPTKSELMKEWASAYFKPASYVLRTRVDLKQLELITFERKDRVQLAADAQRLYGIRPADSLETLYTVFMELSTLGKGSYLLHHSAEDGAFASLEESVDSTVTENESVRSLPDYFDSKFALIMDANPPWPKLDCTFVLPRHKFFNTMPATYHPRPRKNTFAPNLKKIAQLEEAENSRREKRLARDPPKVVNGLLEPAKTTSGDGRSRSESGGASVKKRKQKKIGFPTKKKKKSSAKKNKKKADGKAENHE